MTDKKEWGELTREDIKAWRINYPAVYVELPRVIPISQVKAWLLAYIKAKEDLNK